MRWTHHFRSALRTSFREGAILKNHLRIALRNLRRQPAYSMINIGGLAVGLATCFVILLFVRHELSYDDFHEHADRIYRIVSYSRNGDTISEDLIQSAALAPTIVREVPGIEKAVRVTTRYPQVLVKRGDAAFYEGAFYFTDSSFFEIFHAPFLRGDSASALARPYTVVLSESIADKYFQDENPIGKSLSIEGLWGPHDYEVTAVVRDFPPNSHFHFGFLTSLETLRATMPNPADFESWFHVGHHTYVMLSEGVTPADLGDDLRRLYSRYRGSPDAEEELEAGFGLQPLTDIHLYSHLERELEPNSDARYLYIFSALAFLVLAGGLRLPHSDRT